MQKENKKKLYVCGAIIAVIIIILLLIFLWPHKYKVELMVDNEIYSELKIAKGNTIKEIEDPVKEGYDFIGWYNDDEEYDLNTKITDDLKLEAKFSKKRFTIVIDNGKKVETKEIEYGSKLTKPATPTKKGYKFLGWYNGDEEYDFTSKIISNINITAKWEKINSTEDNKNTTDNKENVNNGSYTVEHYLMTTEGKYLDIPNIKEEKSGKVGSIATPKVKNIDGFISPEERSITIEDNNKVTIKYYYERKKFDLNLSGDKGIKEVIGKGNYYYQQLVKINVTLNDGYEFVKWSNGKTDQNISVEMPLQDINLKATTKEIEYTITYNVDENVKCTNCTKDVYTKYTVEKGITELPTPTKAGYTFNGWYVGEKEYESIEKGTIGNLSLEAKWSANTDTPYKVIYHIMDTNGEYSIEKEENGTGETDTKIEYTPNIAKFVVDINGFENPILKDSENGEELALDNIIINGDGSTKLNYYVARKQFILSIKENEGLKFQVNPQKENNKYYYEEEINITTTMNNGYEFVKWSNEEITKDINITMGAKDTILEATTNLITYNITFDISSDTDVKCENCGKLTYNLKSDKIELPIPTKAGYTFNGWVKNNTNELVKEVETGSYGDLSLTLSEDSFTANTNTLYKVIYHIMDINGEYVDKEPIEEHGTTDEAPNYTPNIEEFVTDVKGFETPKLKSNEQGEEEDLNSYKIDGNGTTVLNYYVVRKQFNLIVELDEGISKLTINEEDKTIESNTYKEKYYYEQSVEIKVETKKGYHLAGESTMNFKIPVDGKKISIVSEGNLFTIQYHEEDGSDSDMDNSTFRFGDEYSLTLNTITKEDYKLTIKNYDNQGNQKEKIIKNNFKGWTTEQGSKDIKYKDQDTLNSYVPETDGDKIDLYPVFETEKYNLEKLPDKVDYYFKDYTDADGVVVKENSEYTISEDTVLTANWLEVITLKKFDSMVMEDADLDTFNSIVTDEKNVTLYMNSSSSKSWNSFYVSKFAPFLSGKFNELVKDLNVDSEITTSSMISKISIQFADGEIFETTNDASFNTMKLLTAIKDFFGTEAKDVHGKKINVCVYLNSDKAIAENATFQFNYTINIESLVEKSEIDKTADNAFEKVEVPDRFTVDKSKRDSGEIVIRYNDPNLTTYEMFQENRTDIEGNDRIHVTTVINRFFANKYVKSLEVTFMDEITDYDYVTGVSGKTMIVDRNNLSDFTWILNSDISKFGANGIYSYPVSKLYAEGVDSKRYKLKIKVNLYVDTDVAMPTEYTILFAPQGE